MLEFKSPNWGSEFLSKWLEGCVFLGNAFYSTILLVELAE